MVATSGPLSDDSLLYTSSAWQVLAENIGTCLVKSDLKHAIGNDGASSGWTSWVDQESALQLQSCMDRLCFAHETTTGGKDELHLASPLNKKLNEQEGDTLLRWMKWMLAAPTPMILDFSTVLRVQLCHHLNPIADEALATTTNSHRLNNSDNSQEQLKRISAHLIVLPSGQDLGTPIQNPAGAMAYGKLLMGGIKRYRLVGSSDTSGSNMVPSNRRRRAGERSEIYHPNTTQAWLQYGGADRQYEAMDIGYCVIWEITLLPKGTTVTTSHMPTSTSWDIMHHHHRQPIRMDPSHCNIHSIMLDLKEDTCEHKSAFHNAMMQSPTELLSVQRDVVGGNSFESTLTTTVGGLQAQVQAIVRRVLDSRAMQLEEAQALAALGLQPVRGLLLYGPPGCGKTILAREISQSLQARPAKIVAAPELLNRWVGGSEKLIRELFEDAEIELRECQGDPTKSALHVIVIDEIDAVFRQRSASSTTDSGEITRASAVNQILAKLDGVQALGNVLLIGLTNRKELLDDALLRPGRLEVHIEIPLPDPQGRREILNIHFRSLRTRGRLSLPLCQAIDGTRNMKLASAMNRWGQRLAGAVLQSRSIDIRSSRIQDLASNQCTAGFSGADLARLVRCAGSIALARVRRDGGTLDTLLITLGRRCRSAGRGEKATVGLTTEYKTDIEIVWCA